VPVTGIVELCSVVGAAGRVPVPVKGSVVIASVVIGGVVGGGVVGSSNCNMRQGI